ncbi:uncharacterized protein sS8_2124 [Methylocaldum marinum]|uniref:Chromosome segregation ATPase n=1 Tax=Methylocaldum marinum TaxID=1432792 RepID=A0A250KRA4_9GAMM|nr:DUF4404 family protein [Methylocaldum marinum]BBA34076.1 uncharacterized protein sS8_2124 [Methylocaldum marinum]
MTEKEVSEALFNLRKEIEQLSSADSETRVRLETLLADLERQLEASEDEHQLHLIEDLKEAISQFEVEHPRITGILNELMVALSNLGI